MRKIVESDSANEARPLHSFSGFESLQIWYGAGESRSISAPGNGFVWGLVAPDCPRYFYFPSAVLRREVLANHSLSGFAAEVAYDLRRCDSAETVNYC